MKRIHNYIVIEISGWERERFVNLCCRRGITLYNCQCVKETIRARITRQDYFKTKEMRRKCHVHIKVLKKHDIAMTSISLGDERRRLEKQRYIDRKSTRLNSSHRL